MKKSLIALAALAATGAFAQSSVQITGGLDAGFHSYNYKGNKVNGIAGNGASTSALFVKGTEDLGGGLSANFLVETDWNVVSGKANTGAVGTTSATATTSTFGNGEIKVGLAGGFGTVDLGSPNYNSLVSHLTGQPFGTAIGSGFSATSARLVRAENAARYITPSFGGLTAVLYKSNKQTKAAASNADFSATLGAYDQTGVQEVGVNYANGPLAASFTNQKQDNVDVVGGTTDTTYNTLGANYALGAAKVFALYQTTKKSDSSVNNKYAAVSGTYAMGATTLMAQFGELENKDGVKSKLSALGADYALSKRTTAYARYETINDKAGVAAVTGFTAETGNVTRARTAIGVRHAF
jgi:predicted porin